MGQSLPLNLEGRRSANWPTAPGEQESLATLGFELVTQLRKASLLPGSQPATENTCARKGAGLGKKNQLSVLHPKKLFRRCRGEKYVWLQ